MKPNSKSRPYSIEETEELSNIIKMGYGKRRAMSLSNFCGRWNRNKASVNNYIKRMKDGSVKTRVPYRLHSNKPAISGNEIRIAVSAVRYEDGYLIFSFNK